MSWESRLLDGTIVWHLEDEIQHYEATIIESEEIIRLAKVSIDRLKARLPQGEVWWCAQVEREGVTKTIYHHHEHLVGINHWHGVLVNHLDCTILRSFEITEDEYNDHYLDADNVEINNISFTREVTT